jgi:hypothetical protein
LKFINYVTQVAALCDTLPVLFRDPACHFGRNGSKFLGYRLLKTSQSLGTVLVYLGFEIAPEKKKSRARRQHAREKFI